MPEYDHDEVKSSVSSSELTQYIDRIERLEDEKALISESIKEVYAELKARGFSVPATKAIVRMRKKDEQKREEEQAILDLYLDALNMR
jgi:uncharacterized protein (UPF0335 family)